MFIIDTNFLINDYKNLDLLEGDIIIPITVIKELDNRKNDEGHVGYNSRKSLRLINDAIDNDYTFSNNNKLIIDDENYDSIGKNDDKIIESAANTDNGTLVTSDIGMKINAITRGINVRMFSDGDNVRSPGKVEEVVVDHDLLLEIFENKKIHYEDIPHENKDPNSCFLLVDEFKTGSAIVRRIGDHYIKLIQPKKVFGKVTGRNVAQRIYLDMLLDPRIKVILVTGIAGSGKTLLALAAACQLRGSKKFSDIICAKSVEEVGQKIGYRPGEEESKIGPYYAAFGDNLEYLAQSDISNGRMTSMIPRVSYEHVGYMRGRTFRDSFIIYDECQNFSPNEIKTMISRAGEGSKVVCCGDIHQIDNNQSKYTNGLFYAQRKLVGNEMVGVITLNKSERSDISKLCALL